MSNNNARWTSMLLIPFCYDCQINLLVNEMYAYYYYAVLHVLS